MREFWQFFGLCAPLFVIVFVGFLIATIASSLVLSTGLASITTPVLLALLHAVRADL